MNKIFTTLLFIGSVSFLNAQNVGIGTAAPNASAKLEITDANRGVLIPRVSLTATNAAAPVTAPATSLLVYNTATAGTAPNNVTPGYYYWTGTAWARLLNSESTDWKVGTTTATTNALAATGFLGTSTNQHIDLVSNNIVRGRLSNLGEFFIGATNTVIAGDLMNGVSNTTFPWAINGYSAFNGAGVYGQVTTGTTIFAGVQGEYNGTNPQGSGTRGIYLTTTAGTGFNASATGVNGQAISAGSYKFGVYGSGGTSTRSGGVFGYDYGISGALGYYSSGGLDYSVYGFGIAYATGVAAGRTLPGGNIGTTTIYNDGNTELAQNAHIGLGIYGGVMGGWVRGLKYGFHAKGQTYGLYVDGKGYTNQPFTYLMPTSNDERVAGYMASAMQPEVSTKGKVQLRNGQVYVAFDNNFKKVMSSDLNNILVVATPQGNSNGIYIDNITADGFWIRENNNGSSNVQITWTATTPVGEMSEIAEELLNKEFDRKMENVMYNDNNTNGNVQPLWWDGSQMRWDTPPAKQNDPSAADLKRPRN